MHAAFLEQMERRDLDDMPFEDRLALLLTTVRSPSAVDSIETLQIGRLQVRTAVLTPTLSEGEPVAFGDNQ